MTGCIVPTLRVGTHQRTLRVPLAQLTTNPYTPEKAPVGGTGVSPVLSRCRVRWVRETHHFPSPRTKTVAAARAPRHGSPDPPPYSPARRANPTRTHHAPRPTSVEPRQPAQPAGQVHTKRLPRSIPLRKTPGPTSPGFLNPGSQVRLRELQSSIGHAAFVHYRNSPSTIHMSSATMKRSS